MQGRAQNHEELKAGVDSWLILPHIRWFYWCLWETEFRLESSGVGVRYKSLDRPSGPQRATPLMKVQVRKISIVLRRY